MFDLRPKSMATHIPEHFFNILDSITNATNEEEFLAARLILNREKTLEKYKEIIKKISNKIILLKTELSKNKGNNFLEKQIIIQQETRKLRISKQTVENEIKMNEKIAKFFIQSIEDSSSPQEVDIYISYIEDAEISLYKDIVNIEDLENPIRLKKLLRFLKMKEQEIREKTRASIWQHALESINKTKYKLIRIFSVWIPDSLEGGDQENISLKEIQEAIKYCENKIKVATNKIINKISIKKRSIFEKKIKVLQSLSNYAETSKKNFNQKLFAASVFHINSVIFTLISATASIVSGIAKAFFLVPGFNLIADGIKKAADTISFSSLTAAYAIDPAAPKEEKIAALRHYQALIKYSIAEASLGAIGTLSMTAGIFFPIIPATSSIMASVPVLGPTLLIAGAAVMAISNMFACINSYMQLQHVEKILSGHPLIKELPEIKRKEALLNAQLTVINKKSKNIKLTMNEEKLLKAHLPKLTDEEKKLLRTETMVQAKKAQFWSKFANMAGSIFLTLSATALLATALTFPPVAIALTLTTVAFSICSIYKQHQEKFYSKKAIKINQELENKVLSKAICNFKKNINSKVEIKHKKDLTKNNRKKLYKKAKESFNLEISPIYSVKRNKNNFMDVKNKHFKPSPNTPLNGPTPQN
jgi:hypothetical protein